MRQPIRAATCFLETPEGIYFQRRRKGVMFAEMIGTFGGKLEEGENSQQALRRELAEEIEGFEIEGDKLCLLGTVQVLNEYPIVMDVYNLPIESFDYHVKDGSELFISHERLRSHLGEYTPGTEQAILKFK